MKTPEHRCSACNSPSFMAYATAADPPGPTMILCLACGHFEEEGTTKESVTPAYDPDEDPGECSDCGTKLSLVRPGKSQYACKCWYKSVTAAYDMEIGAFLGDRYYGSWETLIVALIARVKAEQNELQEYRQSSMDLHLAQEEELMALNERAKWLGKEAEEYLDKWRRSELLRTDAENEITKLLAEVERLKEFEWKYKDLCK